MSRRPTTADMAGRRLVCLPQQKVLDDLAGNIGGRPRRRLDDARQGRPAVTAMVGGVFLLRSQCGGLRSVRATGVMQNVHTVMRNCTHGVRTHSMKASHDTCGHHWQRGTPVDFDGSGVLASLTGWLTIPAYLCRSTALPLVLRDQSDRWSPEPAPKAYLSPNFLNNLLK